VELVRNILVLAASLLSGAAAAFGQKLSIVASKLPCRDDHKCEGAEIFVRSEERVLLCSGAWMTRQNSILGGRALRT